MVCSLLRWVMVLGWAGLDGGFEALNCQLMDFSSKTEEMNELLFCRPFFHSEGPTGVG